MAAGSPPPPEAGGGSFVEWLKRVPTDFKLLAGAAAAVGGVLAPERLIPVPLSDYRWIPSLVILLALMLTWAWQRQLRAHRRAVTAVTLALFVVIVALNLRYVRAVDYRDPPETISYLTGHRIVDPALCGPTARVAIEQCGGDWEGLEAAWGSSFLLVVVAYALFYVVFVTAVILSLGAVMLERGEAKEG